jgi:hypothetical protein
MTFGEFRRRAEASARFFVDHRVRASKRVLLILPWKLLRADGLQKPEDRAIEEVRLLHEDRRRGCRGRRAL